MDLDLLLPEVISWARGAGAIQMSYFRTGQLDPRAKLNDADIVTAADAACESFITARISDAFPDHSILSEESGEHRGCDSEWRWVVDPLDGTTNFNAGLPLFCVSIALQHHGETVLGVVYAPRLDELFTAIRGDGARLNGEPVSAAREDCLGRMVVATGFPVDKGVNSDNNLDNVARVMPHVRGLRRLGSAALDMCYVAAGFLDAYWELNLHLWDVAAAELIVTEGGGVARRFRPDSQERNVCMLAASSKAISVIEPFLK